MSDEEEDYMSMALPGDVETEEEALKRERYERMSSRDRSLHQGLATSLIEKHPESKGLKIMRMMGFKEDPETTGPPSHGPITLEVKSDRGGIGSVSAKRVHEVDQEERLTLDKKARSDYRDRIGDEARSAKLVADIVGAQKALIEIISQETDRDVYQERPEKLVVYIRAMIRAHQEKTEMKRLQHSRWYGLDTTETGITTNELKAELESEPEPEPEPEPPSPVSSDYDKETFESLPLEQKRDSIVKYLREKYYYCFYCGARYSDIEDLKHCPGPFEEDHDSDLTHDDHDDHDDHGD